MTIRAILALFLTCSLAPGQNADKREGGMVMGMLREVATFDLDFAGGTLRELLELLRERDGTFQYVLFVDDIDEGELEIPPMRLRQVNVTHVMDLLADAGLGYDLEIQQIRNSPIFRVSVAGRREKQQAGVLRVFNLRPAALELARQNKQPAGAIGNEELKPRLDEIMTAVAQAVTTAAPEEKSPQISFHPATCVLLIRGSASQVRAVEELIAALVPGSSPFAAGPGTPAAADPLVVRGVLLDAEAQNARLRDQNMMLQQQINQLRAAASTQPSAK
jgi:hypothetical protein